MGFQFGKQSKSLSVESETVQRWRQAATRPGERAEGLEKLRELPKVDWSSRIDDSAVQSVAPQREALAQESLFESEVALDFSEEELTFEESDEADEVLDDDFESVTFPDERHSATAFVESVSAPKSNVSAVGKTTGSTSSLGVAGGLSSQSMVSRKPQAVELTEEIKTALGPGTIIEGKFSFENPVRIDGTLKGEVHSSSLLIVGENALIEASVEVGTLVVHGEVRGNVVAEELVEIREGGCLRGDIQTNRIVIQDGAEFQGRVSERS